MTSHDIGSDIEYHRTVTLSSPRSHSPAMAHLPHPHPAFIPDSSTSPTSSPEEASAPSFEPREAVHARRRASTLDSNFHLNRHSPYRHPHAHPHDPHGVRFGQAPTRVMAGGNAVARSRASRRASDAASMQPAFQGGGGGATGKGVYGTRLPSLFELDQLMESDTVDRLARSVGVPRSEQFVARAVEEDAVAGLLDMYSTTEKDAGAASRNGSHPAHSETFDHFSESTRLRLVSPSPQLAHHHASNSTETLVNHPEHGPVSHSQARPSIPNRPAIPSTDATPSSLLPCPADLATNEPPVWRAADDQRLTRDELKAHARPFREQDHSTSLLLRSQTAVARPYGGPSQDGSELEQSRIITSGTRTLTDETDTFQGRRRAGSVMLATPTLPTSVHSPSSLSSSRAPITVGIPHSPATPSMAAAAVTAAAMHIRSSSLTSNRGSPIVNSADPAVAPGSATTSLPSQASGSAPNAQHAHAIGLGLTLGSTSDPVPAQTGSPSRPGTGHGRSLSAVMPSNANVTASRSTPRAASPHGSPVRSKAAAAALNSQPASPAVGIRSPRTVPMQFATNSSSGPASPSSSRRMTFAAQTSATLAPISSITGNGQVSPRPYSHSVSHPDGQRVSLPRIAGLLDRRTPNGEGSPLPPLGELPLRGSERHYVAGSGQAMDVDTPSTAGSKQLHSGPNSATSIGSARDGAEETMERRGYGQGHAYSSVRTGGMEDDAMHDATRSNGHGQAQVMERRLSGDGSRKRRFREDEEEGADSPKVKHEPVDTPSFSPYGHSQPHPLPLTPGSAGNGAYPSHNPRPSSNPHRSSPLGGHPVHAPPHGHPTSYLPPPMYPHPSHQGTSSPTIPPPSASSINPVATPSRRTGATPARGTGASGGDEGRPELKKRRRVTISDPAPAAAARHQYQPHPASAMRNVAYAYPNSSDDGSSASASAAPQPHQTGLPTPQSALPGSNFPTGATAQSGTGPGGQPLSPVVMGFSTSTSTEQEQLTKTLTLKKQQQALIESRQRGNSSAGAPGRSPPAATAHAQASRPASPPRTRRPTIVTSDSAPPARTGEEVRPSVLEPAAAQTSVVDPASARIAGQGQGNSILARRRGAEGNKGRTLTVMTPAMHSGAGLAGIKSAPLRPMEGPWAGPSGLAAGVGIGGVSIARSGQGVGLAATPGVKPGVTTPRTTVFPPGPAISGRHILAPSAPGSQRPHDLPSPPQAIPHYRSNLPLREGVPSNPPHTAHPSTYAHPSTLHRSPKNIPAAAVPQNKAAFLSVFESFYDSITDSRTLQSTLEDQIRKSAALLTTLQSSEAVLESMVDKRLQEMQASHTKDLQVLEKRLETLEFAQAGGQPAAGGKTLSIADLLVRLERLERAASK